MNHEDADLKKQNAVLKRGILRTFKRDVIAAAIGAAVGATLGLILGAFFGGGPASYVKLGALLGVLVFLLFRNTFSKLFEYDNPPQRGD